MEIGGGAVQCHFTLGGGVERDGVNGARVAEPKLPARDRSPGRRQKESHVELGAGPVQGKDSSVKITLFEIGFGSNMT